RWLCYILVVSSTRIFFSSSFTSLTFSYSFFFNATSTTQIYTLSLHDALPISSKYFFKVATPLFIHNKLSSSIGTKGALGSTLCRSEEHTSELQSRFDLVCRLLLEKKKKKTKIDVLQ